MWLFSVVNLYSQAGAWQNPKWPRASFLTADGVSTEWCRHRHTRTEGLQHSRHCVIQSRTVSVACLYSKSLLFLNAVQTKVGENNEEVIRELSLEIKTWIHRSMKIQQDFGYAKRMWWKHCDATAFGVVVVGGKTGGLLRNSHSRAQELFVNTRLGALVVGYLGCWKMWRKDSCLLEVRKCQARRV